MFNSRSLLFLAILSLAAAAVPAQPSTVQAVQQPAAATRFFPLSEIREGLRGRALTVFRGTEPEEFNVEILGVVPGSIGPKQDLIIGRISGGEAERTGVFAGMSGSPVYIGDRLVGAISYSFPFAKEAICGITPIEQMVSIFEKRQSEKAGPHEANPISFAELASAGQQIGLPNNGSSAATLIPGVGQNSSLMAVAGLSFQPIATPVTFNGISQQALDQFAPQLIRAGLLPVAAVGGRSNISPLKPADARTLTGGRSVVMELARGDYSLSASGTVTLRDGDKIYAFGHPFLSLGTSDLPMSESHVVTVVPNLNNSFKMAVPDAMVGSMTQDRATGVFGGLGKAPKMIPVKIDFETSRGQTGTVNFEVINDSVLTPLLLNVAVFNTLLSQERSLGDMTVSVTGQIGINGHRPIEIDRRVTGGQAPQITAASVAAPISVLLKNRFDDLDLTGINITLRSTDGSRIASLERISVDRAEVRAGEAVNIQAFARTGSGRVFVQNIPLKVPADTAAGTYSITVGDGTAVQQNSAIQQFVPRDLGELVNTINDVKLPDRLYVQMFRTTPGAVIGAREMPNLPPSVLATLNNDRTAGGVKPAVNTVVTEAKVAPADFIITGQQTLSVAVVR